MAIGIGKRLKEARKLRGLTQQQLATKAGVKQASISDLERGESKSFRGTTLVSIAQTLKVRPDWLETGKGRMDGLDQPLPVEAERVARNWLKLAPEARVKIADLIATMVETSGADKEAVPDSRVEAAYGMPPSKTTR